MQPVTIIAKHGSHFLVCRDRETVDREYAVIERRNGQVCGLDDAHRDGFADDARGIVEAVGECWTDEATARRLFEEIAERGDDLARRIW